jgi:8-oxo-dGTP pyrophosphatase MutT (NUDIX family)
MKKPRLRFGNIIFWVIWPVIYLYLRPSHRSRVLVIADNKLLVVMDRLGRREWTIPGGGLHVNEIALNSAVREVGEETGISLERGDLKPLTVNQVIRESGFRYLIDSFWIKLPAPLPIKKQTNEIYAAEWIPIEELIDHKSLFSKTSKELLGTWLEQHHLLD